MIEADKRKAVYALSEEGMSAREISRLLKVSRNTVRAIIRQAGTMPRTVRRDKIQIDPELLGRLYDECDGWIERVHEKLVEEEGIRVAYPTLTRLVRELGIGKVRDSRCAQVPDEPGAEMQHDTTLCQVPLAGKPVKLVASLLYLRYSKRRYLKFYRAFDRFRMKCFFHEALMYWGYAAAVCIVDNTSLVRLRGAGAQALIVPEMESFSKPYRFAFRCHAINHPNRKAGEERSFWTVETNFLPGRSFQSLEELNGQAFQWATVRMENRATPRTGLIPAKAFEHECAFLVKLPEHLPAPYRVHERGTDQYGYAAFDGNYYWVPGTGRQDVRLLQYRDRLKIYLRRECLCEYLLPADGVKNAKFWPEGAGKPPHQPQNRRRPTGEEEKRLRGMGDGVGAYLDFALAAKGIQRHRMVRELFALSGQMTATLFLRSIERALHYRITTVETIRRIAQLCISQDERILPSADVDESYRQRDAYRDGALTDAPDFTVYDDLLAEDDEEEEDANG